MENIFDSVPATGAESVPAATTPADNAKKEKILQMKESLRQTIADDPTFLERMGRMSNSIEVVNSLGFGDSGNIVVDKSNGTDGRKLAVTSAIVGYRVANVGEEPIKYITEVWAPDASGKYVPSTTEKVLSPGATADLTRQYMTMFCAQPEISFTLKNGKIIKGSGSKGDKGSKKAELESFYFSFSKEADGTKKQINDDDVKLNVGEKVGDKWQVKAEFVETFGFLNNPKEGGKAGRKSGSGQRFTAQDVAANYIWKMIQNESM